LQQPALLVCAALLPVHGPSPLGPVLHGRLARRPSGHLDDRRGHLRRQHPHGLHRLPVAAELRFAVHRHQRQGCDERCRCRRLLQRPQLRPDVRPARDAAPDRCHLPRRGPHRHGPFSRRRQADRTRREVGEMSLFKQPMTQDEYYRGVRMARYDLVKELTYALIGVAVIALVLAAAFSSPDVPPITVASWAKADSVDFVTTATGELAGSTTSAGYGAPYNNAGGEQSWGPIAPQVWFGQRIP